MHDWDILAILLAVFVFGLVVFVWLPARRCARRRRRRERRINSGVGDSGNFDGARHDYDGFSDSGGGD